MAFFLLIEMCEAFGADDQAEASVSLLPHKQVPLSENGLFMG